MNTTLKILSRAREILADEERWTQLAGARDINEKICDPRSEEACSWCTASAIKCAALGKNYTLKEYYRAIRVIEAQIDGRSIYRWNDRYERTHNEVLSLLDRTIGVLKAASRRRR